MKKRIRIHPTVLDHERLWVTQFALECLIPDPGRKLSMGEVFEAYKKWLASTHGPTEITVTGFGRLFPKHYERATAFYQGKNRKCVSNVGVIQ